MVNSLSHLGLPPNTPPENRCLAIELVGLVVSWEKQCQAETKAAMEVDTHSLPTDAPTSVSGSANNFSSSGSLNAKRPSDGQNVSDDFAKRVKLKGDSSIGVASPSTTTNPNTPSANQSDEEYKPNAAMEEMIINFLIRVALVTEPKDKEMSAMYKQALYLLSQALEVWPTANIKYNYLEKLLTSLNLSGQSKDPSIALAQGLDVMNKVLAKQPHLFIRNNVQQITQEQVNTRTKTDLTAVTSNVISIQKLMSPRILHIAEGKCIVGQILPTVLSDKGIEGSVLLTVLDMVKDWIENDFRPSGNTNLVGNKDVLIYLQKLSQVDRQNPNLSAFLEEWDCKYLQLLYRLCSDNKYPTN